MAHTNLRKTKKTAKNQAGFSLIEATISMLLFLMVTGTIYGLLQLGTNDRSRSSRRTDTLKNARASTYLISRDMMNAGLGFNKGGALVPDDFLANKLETIIDVGVVRDTMYSVNIGNNVNTSSISTDASDTIAFAYRDLRFNNGLAIQTINETSANANQIVLTTTPGGTLIPVGQPNAGTPLVKPYDVFLAELDTAQVLVMATAVNTVTNQITFTYGDNLGLNQVRTGNVVPDEGNSRLRKCGFIGAVKETVNCTDYSINPAIGAKLKKVVVVRYKIDSEGTLVRITYGNNTAGGPNDQIQTQPLVFGVKKMQFDYVLKDGTVTDDPVKGLDNIRGTIDDTPGKTADIRQVEMDLTLQAGRNEQNQQPDFVNLKLTFGLRNMQYDER
jgi:Prokaryotic N-terminal methylation motif